jgi:hypothetical protein
MDEARSLRHMIPLRDTEWDWVPEAARVALPALTAQASFDRPRSIPVVSAAADVSDAATRNLSVLAVEIVPIHDQTVAMYAWFAELTELETERLLEKVALPDEVTKTLRAIPWAHEKVWDEVKVQADAYIQQHQDRGGWTQLSAIIDWTFFLGNWKLLQERQAEPAKVVTAISQLVPDRPPLLTLSQIRAIGRRQ